MYDEHRPAYVQSYAGRKSLALAQARFPQPVRARAHCAELRLEGRTAFPESAVTTLMVNLDPDYEASRDMRLAKIERE